MHVCWECSATGCTPSALFHGGSEYASFITATRNANAGNDWVGLLSLKAQRGQSSKVQTWRSKSTLKLLILEPFHLYNKIAASELTVSPEPLLLSMPLFGLIWLQLSHRDTRWEHLNPHAVKWDLNPQPSCVLAAKWQHYTQHQVRFRMRHAKHTCLMKVISWATTWLLEPSNDSCFSPLMEPQLHLVRLISNIIM